MGERRAVAAEGIAVGFHATFAAVPHGSPAELLRPSWCVPRASQLYSSTAEAGWQKGDVAQSGRWYVPP